MRVYLAQLNFIIGDLEGNLEKMLQAVDDARACGAELLVFSELALSGYPPQDLLTLPHFVDAIERALKRFACAVKGLTAVVGTVRRDAKQKTLFNSAAVIQSGQILGYYDKLLLPTYDVFDEHRYFTAGAGLGIWNIGELRVAITICEDLWHDNAGITAQMYTRNPVTELKSHSFDLLVNISASPYSIDKAERRQEVLRRVVKQVSCPLLFCNQVGGNDNLIFSGRSLVLDSHGRVLGQAASFQEEGLCVDLSDAPMKKNALEQDLTQGLYQALSLGVHDYFHKVGFTSACIGLSGGIDSAVTACIAADSLGAENVLGVGMPSRYSSEGSVSDAKALAKSLGIAYRELPIEGPFQAFLDLLDVQWDLPRDVTEENLQARIRGMLLMAFSNKLGHIVLSTGNKSEMAMGYCTLYGDMCGGLGVLGDVTKSQVYALARWINREWERIPQKSIDKPPSAELAPNQKDSDSLPDYAVIDSVLRAYVERHQSSVEIAENENLPQELVENLVRRIHQNEYKRRQGPPTLRVTEKAFSVGRRFPIVQGWIR